MGLFSEILRRANTIFNPSSSPSLRAAGQDMNTFEGSPSPLNGTWDPDTAVDDAVDTVAGDVAADPEVLAALA